MKEINKYGVWILIVEMWSNHTSEWEHIKAGRRLYSNGTDLIATQSILKINEWNKWYLVSELDD